MAKSRILIGSALSRETLSRERNLIMASKACAGIAIFSSKNKTETVRIHE